MRTFGTSPSGWGVDLVDTCSGSGGDTCVGTGGDPCGVDTCTDTSGDTSGVTIGFSGLTGPLDSSMLTPDSSELERPPRSKVTCFGEAVGSAVGGVPLATTPLSISVLVSCATVSSRITISTGVETLTGPLLVTAGS